MAVFETMRDLAAGDVVLEADMDAIRNNIEYLLDPNHWVMTPTPNKSTTSTSWVSLQSFDIDTHGGPILIGQSGTASNTSASYGSYYNIYLNGAYIGGNEGLTGAYATDIQDVSYVYLKTNLAAGTQTVQWVWRVSGGTGYMQRPSFWVIEL